MLKLEQNDRLVFQILKKMILIKLFRKKLIDFNKNRIIMIE